MKPLLALCLLFTLTARAAETNAPAIVARVNGADITRAELDAALRGVGAQQAMELGMPPGDEALRALEPKLLEQLIGEQLMAQKAATIPVEDLETKVQEQLRALRAEFDDKTFAEALRAQGLTAAGLQQRITETLRIETLIDREVRAKIAVTEAEAKTFYDQNPDYFTQPAQVRASHILVTVPDDADDAAKAAKRKAIDAARARIVAGEDFAKVAAEVSACPSKSRGGDLDFFGPGQMVPAFEEAAFALKSNEVSEVVTTRFGYHLIKQTGNRPGSLTPFAQAQDRIIQFLRQQKLRTGLLAYVAALRKDAKVEVLLK